MSEQTSIVSSGGQFLTFTLADEVFGLEILRVQEIKGHTAIAPLPNAPVYVKGLINLRGAVIPILDLRCKFGMPAIDYTKFSVIIVVTLGARVVGLVVDAVSDVIDLTPSDIAPPPELDGAIDVSFLVGLGKCGDQLVTLLDIDRLVAGPAADGSADAAA